MDKIIKLKGCCEQEEGNICKALNLNPSEYRCLALVKPGEIYGNDDLSRELNLSKSRGSRVFEGLRQKGYLEKKPGLEDKRSCRYCLSGEGIKIQENISELKRRCESKITKLLNEQDREKLYEGLDLLLVIMEETK